MSDIISYWFSAISSIMNSFFHMSLDGNVSFGAFIVACFIMSLLVRYTYTKIVK